MIFLKAETINLETVKTIKPHCGKVINWYMDPIVELEHNLDFDLISEFDLFLVKDKFIEKRLKELGINNVRFLLEAFDPEIYKPIEKDSKYESDVSLVGNIYPYRLRILKFLQDYNLKVWGQLVNINKADVSKFYQGRAAILDEKNKIFNSAKIVLNTHTPSEVMGTNVRLFEICGSGAFQLSDPTLHTDNIFKSGKEVVYYESVEELKKLIDYYLNNKEERNKIAKAGYGRAMKDHTYDKRLSELFDLLSIRS